MNKRYRIYIHSTYGLLLYMAYYYSLKEDAVKYARSKELKDFIVLPCYES